MDIRLQQEYNGSLKENGVINEHAVMHWLLNYLKVQNLTDVRASKEYQSKEIDFIFDYKGTNIKLEVKADKHISDKRNLFFEQSRIYHFQTHEKRFFNGWGWNSEADIILFRNSVTLEAYTFQLEKLRIFIINQLISNHKAMQDFYKIIPTDKEKTTFGFAIPFRLLTIEYNKYIIDNVNITKEQIQKDVENGN